MLSGERALTGLCRQRRTECSVSGRMLAMQKNRKTSARVIGRHWALPKKTKQSHWASSQARSSPTMTPSLTTEEHYSWPDAARDTLTSCRNHCWSGPGRHTQTEKRSFTMLLPMPFLPFLLLYFVCRSREDQLCPQSKETREKCPFMLIQPELWLSEAGQNRVSQGEELV